MCNRERISLLFTSLSLSLANGGKRPCPYEVDERDFKPSQMRENVKITGRGLKY